MPRPIMHPVFRGVRATGDPALPWEATVRAHGGHGPVRVLSAHAEAADAARAADAHRRARGVAFGFNFPLKGERGLAPAQRPAAVAAKSRERYQRREPQRSERGGNHGYLGETPAERAIVDRRILAMRRIKESEGERPGVAWAVPGSRTFGLDRLLLAGGIGS